jgi:hypothetical protein
LCVGPALAAPLHVRILTLNVFGFHRDWKKRQSALHRGFSELLPDTVTLQESIKTDAYDQVVDSSAPTITFCIKPGMATMASARRSPAGGRSR